MNKTHNNNFYKKTKTKTNKSKGGAEFNKKYSLESIDEGNEIGGFKHSNTIISIFGIGSLLYYVFYKQNMMNNTNFYGN